MSIISFALSLILTYIFLPMLKEMLISNNLVCENYKSEMIPTAMGLAFIFAQVLTMGIVGIIYEFNNNFNLVYLFGFVFIGLLGLLDDLIGDKKVKGLKGHIRSFFKGTLTTGAIKAFLGLFISLVISFYISQGLIETILNMFLIGLFTNLINLFDLRPGRAIKVFIFISLIFIGLNFKSFDNYIIFSIYGILIPYISLDLKSQAMIGDTGANILGYTLGIYASMNLEINLKILILILLILTHLLAEKTSFSSIIENNKILKFLDDFGR